MVSHCDIFHGLSFVIFFVVVQVHHHVVRNEFRGESIKAVVQAGSVRLNKGRFRKRCLELGRANLLGLYKTLGVEARTVSREALLDIQVVDVDPKLSAESNDGCGSWL